MKLFELSENNLITMYHGGRDLEFSYDEMLGNKSNQSQNGPGLYLTNYYGSARKYAKGGGKVYKVTFKRGIEISEVTLNIKETLHYLNNIRLQNRKYLLNFINNKYKETIPAANLLNLLVNFDCITSGNSASIRNFLAINNIDYQVSYNMAGFSGQTWVVIFNPKIIVTVTIVKPTEISNENYILPVNL